MDTVILAGGLGERLKTIIGDFPKPMAPIGDVPFLNYILKYLNKYGIKEIILATGYKHDFIYSYYKNKYMDIEIKYSKEDEPLGTGGAVQKALNIVQSDDVLVINGDTFFDIDLDSLIKKYKSSETDIMLGLKKMESVDRFGTVIIQNDKIIKFDEKKCDKEGLINGGIYLFNRNIFRKFSVPEKFSFEKDFLERYVKQLKLYGYESKGYFIDIGIPEDYKRAQIELINRYGQ